jgi:hypothetical protein
LGSSSSHSRWATSSNVVFRPDVDFISAIDQLSGLAIDQACRSSQRFLPDLPSLLWGCGVGADCCSSIVLCMPFIGLYAVRRSRNSVNPPPPLFI